MSNFTPVWPGGVVNGQTVTGPEFTQLQARLVKAVNGDEGSSHVGSVVFRGISASHWTDKVQTVAASAASVAVTWNVDTYSGLYIQSTRNNATQGNIPITMSGMLAFERYFMAYESTVDPDDYTIDFASSPNHIFDDGAESFVLGGPVIYMGYALSPTKVLWTCIQRGP